MHMNLSYAEKLIKSNISRFLYRQQYTADK